MYVMVGFDSVGILNFVCLILLPLPCCSLCCVKATVIAASRNLSRRMPKRILIAWYETFIIAETVAIAYLLTTYILSGSLVQSQSYALQSHDAG